MIFHLLNYHKITQSPLPRVLDLLSILFVRTAKVSTLSRGWAREGDIAHWFSRSTWSMLIIARWRQRVTGANAITVWMPNFICNESLVLLREMGAKFVFYPVDERNRPALEGFPEISESNRPDLFFVVHYFGEPSNVESTVAFCRQQGAWLIEDAAHVLQTMPGVGEYADCVLYSPHKLLPIPDGAVLLICKNGPAGLATQRDKLELLNEVVDATLRGCRGSCRTTVVWLAKRLLQVWGIRRNNPLQFGLDYQAAPEISHSPRMSVVAKRLLERELTRLTGEAAWRIQSAAEWQRVICNVFPREICEVISTNCVPYLACLNTSDQKTAELLYLQLNAAGVPVATWPDLPAELFSEKDHEIAHRLRHTRLYLPVHRSVTPKQIRTCGNRLRDIKLSGWRMKQIDTKQDWEGLWNGCSRKSLPQTWEYGSAKAMAEGWAARRFVVLDEWGLPVALFQVLLKGVSRLANVARINRGPLMLQARGEDSTRLALNAIAVLVREAWKQRWLMIQIAPLLPPNEEVEVELRTLGFRRQSICPMDSAVLSLHQSDDQLMLGLNGKWRNCLRKGKKLGVTVIRDDGGQEHFQWLLDFYHAQQRNKGFDGTSDQMLRAMMTKQNQSFRFNLYFALDGFDLKKDKVLGVLVTIQFGDISEYLIGATNESGRVRQANSVLLWESILDAKRNGCRWFDVGGLAGNTPKGIADFKKGLNPDQYRLAGEWRRWAWNR